MSNEPVTDVDPVADSPRSRVEMFKQYTSVSPWVDRQRGEASSGFREIRLKAFSIDAEDNPTEMAKVSVEEPATYTTWQPHHLDGPKLITDEEAHEGFIEGTPKSKARLVTEYERRLYQDPKAQEDGTAPLFYVDQSDAKVDNMYRSKGGANLAGSYLLGAIGKQFSGINKPTYSSALSGWSAALVKKAGELGLVKENPQLPFSYVRTIASDLSPKKKTFNDSMSSSISKDYSFSQRSTQLPQEEVNEFPKIVRSAIADAKSRQFSESLKLPQEEEEEDNTRDVPLPGFENI